MWFRDEVVESKERFRNYVQFYLGNRTFAILSHSIRIRFETEANGLHNVERQEV